MLHQLGSVVLQLWPHIQTLRDKINEALADGNGLSASEAGPGTSVPWVFSRSSPTSCERAAVSVLSQGDGPSLQVYRLSEQLVTTGHLSVTSEEFTPAMDLAVRAFQAQNGLTVDGLFGPASSAKIGHLVGGRRVTSIVVHHTAGSRQNTAAEIDAYHRAQHPSWGGIAYQSFGSPGTVPRWWSSSTAELMPGARGWPNLGPMSMEP